MPTLSFDSTDRPAVTEVFETSDVDVAESMIAAAYGTVRIDDPGTGGCVRLEHTTLTPSVRLERDSLTMSLRMSGDGFDTLVIGELLGGRLSYESDGSERHVVPGDVFLATQPDSRWSGRLVSVNAVAVAIDPALLSQVAATDPSTKAGPVRLTGYRPISTHAATVWKRTYSFVRQLADSQAHTEPLVTAAAARLLVATTLATFPNNALTELRIEDRHDAQPPTVRRGVSFIETHPDLDLTVVDIARAACVTPRALQLAFRRHLNTTPLRYLRRVRLDRAHADLLAADPSADTVTAIAARWGWARSSRFAADYRAAYGRRPHETLRS